MLSSYYIGKRAYFQLLLLMITHSISMSWNVIVSKVSFYYPKVFYTLKLYFGCKDNTFSAKNKVFYRIFCLILILFISISIKIFYLTRPLLLGEVPHPLLNTLASPKSFTLGNDQMHLSLRSLNQDFPLLRSGGLNR